MAQMTVRINGYSYSVGCEDGQEAHLAAMAEQVESRIDSIKALGGQTGEARLLLLASLLLADELHDLKIELAQAATQGRAAKPKEKEMARRLARMASRAEEIAADMEHP